MVLTVMSARSCLKECTAILIDRLNDCVRKHCDNEFWLVKIILHYIRKT